MPVVGCRFSALSDFECSRSTHGCNGKADVIPSNLQFAMPDKSETGGRGESRNAGPSAGRDDAIGTVVVMGESMQRRKLSRHLRPWMMTSKGGRVQRTRAAGGNYVVAIVRMQSWSPHDAAARITRKLLVLRLTDKLVEGLIAARPPQKHGDA